jgi:two-component system chemotaxis sensor kinase CheA
MDTQNGSAGHVSFDSSQFHAVFFEEADEHLANMEMLLLEIDVAAPDDEAVNAIFRAAHSIKGGAGMFGFADVTALTHEAETLFDRVRKGELPLTREIVDAMLDTGDALKAQLEVHRGEGGPEPEVAALAGRLCALAATAATGAGAAAAGADEGYGFFETLPADPEDYGFFDSAPGAPDLPAAGAATTAGPGRARADNLEAMFAALPPAEASPAYGLFDAAPGNADAAYGFFSNQDVSADNPAAAPALASGYAAAATAPRAGTPAKIAKPDKAHEAHSIRVPVEKVDQLINLVGELVITQAMLAQNAVELERTRHQTLLARMADLERNTRDLQDSVMSIRMTPIAMVFNRFPRMLRDLATKLGKQVELKMVGEGTELDKGLIEKITDPMTHLVRNSLDHGIEAPQARAAAGKPEAGTITLSAHHRGGNIVIEVADDGAGLNRQRILDKARERGLAVPADPADADVWNLIFEPGFSTAEVVTDVSGRGVGMDVVRRNIAALGGSVEIDSATGLGTRITVRLPLTLAIMDGMSVASGGDTYILPLASVVESLQADSRVLRPVAGQGRVLEVRGEYLPVLRLADAFPPDEPARKRGATEIIVIVEADGVKTALVVDELLGQHQVVVKSLETNYRRQPGLSGATIMGDGRVALILDISGLIKQSRH